MSLPAWDTRGPHCFQPREHGFKLLAYFCHYRVHLDSSLARGAYLDGLADFDGGMKRSVEMDLIGEILLVSLHRLQHLLGRPLLAEVLGWMEGDLLGEVSIRKLPPPAHPF